MSESWPRVVDEETRSRCGNPTGGPDVWRSLRRLRVLVIILAVALAVAGGSFAWYVVNAADVRGRQFCSTALTAIRNSNPDSPVPAVLIDLYEDAECEPALPPEIASNGVVP